MSTPDDPDTTGSDPPPQSAAAPTATGRPGRGPKHASTRRSRRRARARARKHPWLRRVLFTVGLVLVLLVAAVGGYAYYLNGRVHRITAVSYTHLSLRRATRSASDSPARLRASVEARVGSMVA